MTKKGEGWISRRGQVGAASAVELVLERQPQEPVQQIANELIEDSPYQARQSISDASVAELAQGMRSAGFQGVLIVRPHDDIAKRRQGWFQLVYGHRRRAAWRHVCQERGDSCMLPVVVREVSDAQMLMIGAQENLQRQDLDPVEEGQIIAWAERMFFDKNQAEIGAMIGKSSDWVSTRSRIHKLPEPLKSILTQRPRAVKQVLELSNLYDRDPDRALALGKQIVQDALTVEQLRLRILADERATARVNQDSDAMHNRRASATIVHNGTNETADSSGYPEAAPASEAGVRGQDQHPRTRAGQMTHCSSDQQYETPTLPTIDQLHRAATLLEAVAATSETLPADSTMLAALERVEQALTTIRERLLASSL